MGIKGFVDYKRREFCNDVECPVQMILNKHEKGSGDYEKTREICKNKCIFTTYQFHHWLIEKGYIIIASLKLKNKGSVFASIDKELLKWIDEKVQSGKYRNRSHFIETALAGYKANKQ